MRTFTFAPLWESARVLMGREALYKYPQRTRTQPNLTQTQTWTRPDPIGLPKVFELYM